MKWIVQPLRSDDEAIIFACLGTGTWILVAKPVLRPKLG